MKNTKKLLMILCSAVVLFATVFTLAATAVTAGEQTSIDEYAKMKITASHGFEDGTTNIFRGIGNGNIPKNGRVLDANSVRKTVLPIYGNDTDSLKYFAIDYDTNSAAADLYIQPRVGVYDDVEKTPANGFVAEFDIAFFSPVEIVTVQSTDEYTGEPLWEIESTGIDENGNEYPIYKLDEEGNKIPVLENVKEPLLTDQIKVDAEGNIVYKVEKYVQSTDEDGNLLWETDAEGNPIAVMEAVYALDENGNKIPEYQEKLTAEGEVIMVDKVVQKKFTGLSTTFAIGMYNDYTYEHGKVDLLTFSTDAITQKVKLNEDKNNLLENAPQYSFGADEWCHITVQYDAKTMFTYVYVGRDDSEFDTDGDGTVDVKGRLLVIVKKATYVVKTGETVNVYPLEFRLGCKSTCGVVGFDNFIGYQGTTIHDPTILNDKLPYQKYIYLADVLANEHQYKVVTDTNGEVTYQILTDENGNTVYVPVYEYATDEAGNVIYAVETDEAGNVVYEKNENGENKLDENGNPIPVYAKDADGNLIPEYAKDANGNKIPAYEKDENGEYKLDADGNKIPIYEKDANGNPVPVYIVDSFGNKVPVYELDENGNKIIEAKGSTAVNRYQAFNLLQTDDVLRQVYSGENYGGVPDGDELIAIENATKLLNVYIADKKNDTNNGLGVIGVYDEMVKQAKLENAATYLEYALDAANTERTLQNFSDRATKVSKAKSFYDEVGNLIERDGNGDYGKAVALLEKVEATVGSDEAAYNFVNCVKIFNNSVAYGASASRLRAHYQNASVYYPNISEDYDDPNTTLAEDSVETLKQAVEDYLAAAAIVSQNTKEFNSARFVGVVNMMQKKSSGTWETDGEDVEDLWLRALDILLDGEYDPYAEGFAVAEVIFNAANNYFWAKMQANHIQVISDKLDSYNDPDMTYIDKAGICTYVDRYIDANSKYLDLDSIELNREIARNTAYKAQLNTIVGDYRNLLKQNTTKFINVMKMASQYGTYETLKPLYDEATSYYYTMNIEGEEIDECIAEYEELRSLISSIERDSKAYIDIVYGNVIDEDGKAIYKPMADIDSKEELYKSLVEAYLCFENLDITYPGAAEAKAIYDAKYQEYNNSIVAANKTITNSESVVYAARGNWNFDIVVVFVKKLINTKG